MIITHRINIVAILFIFGATLFFGYDLQAQRTSDTIAIPKTVYITSFEKGVSSESPDKNHLFLIDPIKLISMYNLTYYESFSTPSPFFYFGGVMIGTGVIDDLKGFGVQGGVRGHFNSKAKGWFTELGLHYFSGEKKDVNDFNITLINASVGHMFSAGNSLMLELSTGVDYVLDGAVTAPLFYARSKVDNDPAFLFSFGLGFGLRL